MTTLTATPIPELAAVRLEAAGAPAGPLAITRFDVNGAHLVRQLFEQETSAGVLVVTDYEAALHGALTYELDDGTYVTTELNTAAPVASVAVSPYHRRSVRNFVNLSELVDDAGAEHRILDAAEPVVVAGAMSTRAGTLEAWCSTYEDATALRATLARGEVVLFRHPEHDGMDTYARVRRVAVSPRPELVMDETTGRPTRRWSVTIDYREQSAPETALLSAAGWNFGEHTNLGVTFAESLTLFPTFRDRVVGP
jgi:hypothetical protein